LPIRSYHFGVGEDQPSEPPNAVLRGGTRDGQQLHLGRGEESATYTAASGELYERTDTWERTLRIYRPAIRSAG